MLIRGFYAYPLTFTSTTVKEPMGHTTNLIIITQNGSILHSVFLSDLFSLSFYTHSVINFRP